MNQTKKLKSLLYTYYELERELKKIREQCFEEIFKEHATYIFSLFEEDLTAGRAYNSCLHQLDYYKQQMEEYDKKLKNMIISL